MEEKNNFWKSDMNFIFFRQEDIYLNSCDKNREKKINKR